MLIKTVLIIDDEEKARMLIRQYLKPFSAIKIMAECDNGKDAVDLINEKKPDLIFLDVQMPGLDGFQVLQQINQIPQVIFTTAFDEFAVSAFEHEAVDYLLKPYTKERFEKAINKVINKQDGESKAIQSLYELLTTKQEHVERILLHHGKKLVSVPLHDITWIEASSEYSNVYTKEKKYFSSLGISLLEKKIKTGFFIRVHRSAIVNLQQIQEVEKDNGIYTIIMPDNNRITVSRSYIENFKKHIF